MWKSITLAVVAAFASALVAAQSAALAAKAEVVDTAGFFSADAVAKANEKLAEVEQRTGKQLRVETYPDIPQDLRGGYSQAQRNAFFTKWADQRGKELGLTGAMVLITRDPGHLQISVGKNTSQSGAFTTVDRDRMRDVMTGAFQAKNYDQGLNAAVDLWATKVGGATAVSSADAAPAAGRTESASGTPQPYKLPSESGNAPAADRPLPAPRGFGIGTLLIFAAVIFVGLMFLRRLFGGRRSSASQQPSGYDPRYASQGYDPRYGGGAGAGGGFGRGVGGGLLGGLLGSWIGNNMFGHGGSSAQGSPMNPLPPTDPNAGGGVFDEPPSAGTDFGGGGDIGGGGDFGGGGDSGGGGDF